MGKGGGGISPGNSHVSQGHRGRMAVAILAAVLGLLLILTKKEVRASNIIEC